jgi:large subunit ribosomal protein L23
MDASQIIIEPVLTEKSNILKEGDKKKYVFKVAKKANKVEIMKAISSLYSVKPLACNIVNVSGKRRANMPVSATTYKRGYGLTSSWKKAIITMAPGDKIDILEGV